MSVEFSVPLSQIAEALNLTEVYVAENYKETNISTVEINRPGLELTGYLEFFDNKRIQVLGNTEFFISADTVRRLRKWLLTPFSALVLRL